MLIFKDFRSPDERTFSKILSFLSHNLFVKRFFRNENVHFLQKQREFCSFFSKMGLIFKARLLCGKLKQT